MKGLIIKPQWAELILDGRKSWEIRGSNTTLRGRIAIIESGTGCVYGTVDLIGSMELSLADYQSTVEKHCVPNYDKLPYQRTYAWALANPQRLSLPIPYQHPQGAVIWVNLALPDPLS